MHQINIVALKLPGNSKYKFHYFHAVVDVAEHALDPVGQEPARQDHLLNAVGVRPVEHVHYPALHNIIKKICEERGVHYIEFKNVRFAIASHVAFLRQMGK